MTSERPPSLNRTLQIRVATLVHDIVMAGLAIVLAIAIRTGTFAIPLNHNNIGKIGLFVLIATTVNWLVGLNRGVWRYASLPELIAITKYSAISVFLFTVAVAVLAKWPTLHWATVVLLFVLMIVMTSALRISYRIMRSRRAVSRAQVSRRKANALLIGAGDNAELFLKSIGERNDLSFRPLGIIDERRRRIGLSISWHQGSRRHRGSRGPHHLFQYRDPDPGRGDHSDQDLGKTS